MAEQHHRREEIRRLQKLIDAGDKAESTIKKENDSVVSATRRVKQLLIGVYDYLTDTQDPYRTKAAIHGAPAIGRIPPDNIDLSESIQNASSHMPTIFERPPSPQLAPRTACDVLPDANDMGIPTSPPPSTDYIHEETAVPEQLPNTQSKFTPLDKKGFTQANAQLNLTSNGVSDTAADTEKDLNPSTPPVSSGVLNGADAASFKKDPTLQVSAPLISNKDCNGAESAIPAIAPERTSQSKGMGTFESFLSRATSSGRPTIRPLPEYREAFLAAYEHALQQPQEDQSLKIDTSIARKRKRDTANHGSVGVCNICGVFEAANVQRKTPIARQLVNCSNCEKSFHMGCLDPPMKKRPPRGYAWRCLDCDTTPESESFPDSPDSEVTAPLPKRRRTAPERYE
ncbi:uncharacterized protein EV422DRAFT_242528 [Fimicolochytrium jonesii]|uniref:uncharacterized protein n=1 Tax=Fimicolochytrium jonesii TaxID=1396493 RepID=UPI0022FE5EE0|nr:uncharacterized protein EV422DRAFT_242528 [Fimicolochytrium jonesii]KAI8825023.1 hypothetical protein EV422DRAFT_242528 [Fimicolochytrium jonesii]